MKTVRRHLTEEQKKLIEDNFAYCLFYFSQHNIVDEDKRQKMLYSLCRCIHLYDPNRGTITTFINTVFKSRMIALYNEDKQRKKIFDKLCISLNDSVLSDDEGQPLTWEEIIGNYDATFEDIEYNDFNKYLMRKLEKNKKIKKFDFLLFRAYLETGNQTEVAKMYGISRQAVNEHIMKVRNVIKSKGWLNA